MSALFESFAEAGGARPDAPAAGHVGPGRPAGQPAGADPVAALAVVAAYEVQAGAIAVTKASGLAEHYGIDRRGHPVLGRARRDGG